MDKTQSKYPKKATNKHHLLKPKTKVPLKVVYISNPMKFNTTASEFRTLVQKLTGRDADMPIIPEQTTSNRNGDDHRELMHPHAADHHAAALVKDASSPIKEEQVPTLSVQSSASEMGNGSDLSFDGDDLFGTFELLENVPDFSPSNFWYDTR